MTLIAAKHHEVGDSSVGFRVEEELLPTPLLMFVDLDPGVVVRGPQLDTEHTMSEVRPIVTPSTVDPPHVVVLDVVGEEVASDELPVESLRNPNHVWLLELLAAFHVVGVSLVGIFTEVVAPVEPVVLEDATIQTEILHVGDVLFTVLSVDDSHRGASLCPNDLGCRENRLLVLDVEDVGSAHDPPSRVRPRKRATVLARSYLKPAC
jgi:hypothetical protein